MTKYNKWNKEELIEEIVELKEIIKELREGNKRPVPLKEKHVTLTIDTNGTCSLWNGGNGPKWDYDWYDETPTHYKRQFETLEELEVHIIDDLLFPWNKQKKKREFKILFGKDRGKRGENAKWEFYLSKLYHKIKIEQ